MVPGVGSLRFRKNSTEDHSVANVVSCARLFRVVRMTNRLSKAILQHIATQDDLLRMYSFYRRERHDEIARIFYVDHQFGSAVRRDCTNRAELLTTVRHKGL